MKQTITGRFPYDNNNFIAQDFARAPGSLNEPARTLGAAAVQQLSPLALAVPVTTPRATLLSWSVSAYLAFSLEATSDTPFGRLGKIVAGLSPQAVGIVQGANGQPWSVALPSAPTDATLTETLWDPGTDPMPPSFSGTVPTPQGLLPVTASQNLAYPWPLDPGALPFVVVWLWPSLLGLSAGGIYDYFGLCLLYGTYTVNYDDGQPG